jgi:hypothetical protein
MLYPYFIFISYSFKTLLAATKVMKLHKMKKIIKVVQSSIEHLSIPISEGNLFEPRIIVKKSTKK